MIETHLNADGSSASITISGTEVRQPLETWDKFLNGPNAGMIEIESARREIPWIIGESSVVTVFASMDDDTSIASLPHP